MNVDKIIERQDYQTNGGKVHCGHDFWGKEIEFGEVVLCTRCNNFFAKIKKMPYFVRERKLSNGAPLPAKVAVDSITYYVRVPLQERR